MSRRLHVGDRVRVPWGVETLPGTIRVLYGPRGHPHAVVTVDFGDHSEDEEEPISFPLDALMPETRRGRA